MGSSDITTYEPATGERPDIGLITDASAYAMLGGDPGHMIDWALSSESCPLHFRDQSTDQPIDLLKYPQANAYDNPHYQGVPWLPKGPPADRRALNYPSYGGAWTVQQAHQPELAYVAFQFTGDFGFLEEVGYQANFGVLCDAKGSGPSGAVVSGEYRGIAWALRNLFMASAATQDAEALGALPAYLKPSSYWKRLLTQTLNYYSAQIRADTSPSRTVFHLFEAGSQCAPWECDYLLSALGFGILTGHSDWAEMYLWCLQNAIDRLSGKSGYPPGWGTAYNVDSTLASWGASFAALQANNFGGVGPSAQQLEALRDDPYNGGAAMQGAEYMMTTRAVMAHAQYLDNQGICAVRKTFPNLDACYAAAHKMVANNGVVNPRQSVVSDPSHVPTRIVPYAA